MGIDLVASSSVNTPAEALLLNTPTPNAADSGGTPTPIHA